MVYNRTGVRNDNVREVYNMMPLVRIPNVSLVATRISMGLSQEDMAQLLNMSVKEYKHKENGKKSFRLNEMLLISNITRASLDELFRNNYSVCISVCSLVREGGFEPPQVISH